MIDQVGDRVEFDVNFVPTVTIKGQSIAYFLKELTQFDALAAWKIEVDGSSCNNESGVCIRINE